MLCFNKRRGLLPAVLIGIAAGGLATQAAAQSEKQEQPIPESVTKSLVAIERAFTAPTPAPLTLFPKIRDEMQDAPAFLRDSKAAFNLRTYYRDNVTNSPTGAGWNEAWAAGGSFAFETGRLFDRISGGLVLYTSFPVYAPLDHDGTGLLKPGQQQYGVLGQLYGKFRITDEHEFIAGRYLYDTPFIGPQDNRMSPKTFYGYVLHGSFGNEESGGPYFRYGGGYIAAMKDRNSTDFISMSQVAGAADPRGTGVFGGLFSWGPFRIGGIEYFTQDTINIVYGEAKYGANLAPDLNAVLAAQFADQHSTGMELLNGGVPFGTNQFGAQLQLGYQTAILTAAYTVVNPNFAMQTPWSANPFYTDAQIQAFNRAGENTLMAGLSYGFKPLGLPGVAASVFYYNGWTNASIIGMPLSEYEWDFNLEWRPDWKPLPGLWFRARYGYSWTSQANMVTTVDEVRLTVNYAIKMY